MQVRLNALKMIKNLYEGSDLEQTIEVGSKMNSEMMISLPNKRCQFRVMIHNSWFMINNLLKLVTDVLNY